MTAATKAKAVRRARDEQQGDAGETALVALQRVARLLTDEVIPRLGGAANGMGTGPGNAGRPPPGATPDDVPHADGGIPEPVQAALAELRQTLSAEAADAAAPLFRTIAKSLVHTGAGAKTRLARVSDLGKAASASR